MPDNQKRWLDKTLKTISRPEDDTRPEQDRQNEALNVLDWALDQAIKVGKACNFGKSKNYIF